MSDFIWPYCPRCWPTYAGDLDAHNRCINCGDPMLYANKDKAIDLLCELTESLATSLSEAHGLLKDVLGTEAPPARPKLRLVHSTEEPAGITDTESPRHE
ncbi:hypothetical protein EQG41_11775 [Billgrantia azerbaijanica]|nr:hypothetical protein EQG41_11775 [Halomonas azerbaijanica]